MLLPDADDIDVMTIMYDSSTVVSQHLIHVQIIDAKCIAIILLPTPNTSFYSFYTDDNAISNVYSKDA